MELYTNLVAVEKGNRIHLLTALTILSDFDCDFTGENGPDYNWDETNEAGFESNLEYLLDKVRDIPDDNELVQTFIETWMKKDCNYYNEYSFDTITEGEDVVAISLACVTDR